MATALKLVAKLTNGNRHFSRWRLTSGEIVQTSLTKQAYEDLRKKGAGEPDRKGMIPADAKWMLSASTVAWNTLDRELSFGEYGVSLSKQMYVGVDEHDPFVFMGTKEELLSKGDQIVTSGGVTLQFSNGSLEKL